MHIGFLTLEYPPLPSGGIGSSIRNLARALVDQGHRVSVVGWGHSARFDDRGVAVRFWSRRFLPKTGWLVSRLSLQRELRRLVDHEGLDIVEAHDWSGLSAGIRPGCPIVVRCHGSAVYFAHLLSETVRPSVQCAERLALACADAIAAVSRFAAAETARLFGVRQSIAVLYNGVDLTQFEAVSPAGVEDRTLVYVGTIVRKKGVLDLCRAFSRVVSEIPDASLIVVGRDAPDKATASASTWALCERELSAAAARRVTYLGPQAYERIQQFVQRAAVCVFPSHAEALPVAWLEAMACARPVVAYDIGWAPEIVQEGRTGLLAPHGDVEALGHCVLRLLRDPVLGSALGAAGRSAVEEQFSSQVTATRTADWYRRVLGRPC